MNRSLIRGWLIAGVLGAALPPALAAVELVGAAPKAVLDGLQADQSTGPLQQSIATAASGTIESIVWWGFHGANSLGAIADDFVVTFGGAAQTGQPTKSPDANGVAGLTRYELDIPDVPLVPGQSVLEIVNDSLDVEWFWQHDDQAARPGQAFALMGTRAAPEPLSLAMVLMGLAALGAVRRTRRAPD